MRLPILVHHYLEHVKCDHNKSFADFLAAHYALKITHPDNKHHDHENLPFKSADCSASQVIPILPQNVNARPKMIFIDLDLKKAGYYQPNCSSSCLDSIWQPPRIS